MRRLKHSRLATLLSKTLIAALLFNSMALMLLAPRAEAQLTGTLPLWAVTDFVNNSPHGGAPLAGAATDAFATNIAGTNQASVVPRESVERGIRELSLTAPITRNLDVIRLGQWLGVDVVFVGEVQQSRVRSGANGKSADVVVVIRGIDVASGLPIMGAAVLGQSSERPGDVSDDVLLEEAVNYAAQEATRIVMGQVLEPATVIGTPGIGDAYRVKINKGNRNGIKVGQRMIVTRGREQVGVIEVKSTDADSADCSVITEYKGVAPGDRARVIFDKLPDIRLTGGETGTGVRVRSASKMNTGAALIALLVVGVLATLVIKEGGAGHGGHLVSEAGVAPDNVTPAAVISWKPTIFAGGQINRIEWHVWRNDQLDVPVGVTSGNIHKFYDTTAARAFQWRDFGGVVGGPCEDDPGTTEGAGAGTIPGTTYQYQLSLVYRVSCLNTPGGCDGGTVTDCFYETTRAIAPGQCTVIAPVTLLIPANGSTDVGNNVQFSWTSAAGANEYAVQISTSPAFASANTMRIVARVQTVQGGNIGTDPVNIQNVFPGVQRLYWRVGAKNVGDNPGPVRDAMNERYVYSQPFQFDRVILPPPPPVQQKGIR